MKSLGLTSIPERTIEHDLTLLGRFQEFSAELLRVALIGISAIGFVVARLLFPEKGSPQLSLPTTAKFFLTAALVALTVSAGAALAHRYFAADSMSWHLQAMRRYERNTGSDADTANREFKMRHSLFKWSARSIKYSATALGLGAMALVVAIIVSIP